MTKEIYNAIANKLATVTNNNGNRVFRHIDLWNTQVEFLEQEQPFEMPACFIEITPIQWQQLGRGAQQANIDIALHIVTQWQLPTFHNGTYQAAGTEYLDIPNHVWADLHRHSNPAFGTLMRITSHVNHNHAEIIDSVENYRGVAQIVPQQTETPVTASPVITIGQ
ncbi:MAG: hypothetical protein PHW19_07640 [Salinivirgaceae bacterium]|nr:hypothetical protein [Salinivirgaceae bacterium]